MVLTMVIGCLYACSDEDTYVVQFANKIQFGMPLGVAIWGSYIIYGSYGSVTYSLTESILEYSYEYECCYPTSVYCAEGIYRFAEAVVGLTYLLEAMYFRGLRNAS